MVFSWISLAIALLQFANKIVSWLEREGAIAEGERRAYAKQLAENARRIRVAEAIDKKIEAMTDEEVIKSLEKDFRD